jgi:hypothetical protein
VLRVNQESAKSLLIRMRYSGQDLSIGTAFIANTQVGPVLVTNRHNVTGRNQLTDELMSKTGAVPNEIVVRHNQKGVVGQWVERVEPLYSGETKLWREHPTLGSRADFVALPLTQTEAVDLFPYSTAHKVSDRFLVGPSEIVSVIGFPFGVSASGFGIWATGFIASEPEIDYDNLPVFLIDCRTRPGQSGSPVIAFRNGGAIPAAGGGMTFVNGPVHQFLGIYSGRINKDSDIGMVWKAAAVQQLLNSFGSPPKLNFGIIGSHFVVPGARQNSQ